MLSHKSSSSLLKNLKTSGLALAMSAMVVSPAALADNSASAYFNGDGGLAGAMALAGGAACTDDGWCKVLATTLNNSGNFKDLVIGVSFETMLMTETVVRSKGGSKSEAVADAEIMMKVIVDGDFENPAAPGEIMFDKRTQTLWAELGGVLENCTDTNGDGVVSITECELTDEEIGLILDTAQASTFNFLSYNIGSGSHTIDVYAKLSADGEDIAGTSDNSSSSFSAALGKGTVSVWEVHGAMSK